MIFLRKNIWMNGETLPRSVGASIIEVALIKKIGQSKGQSKGHKVKYLKITCS